MHASTATAITRSPALPAARGPLSSAVIDALRLGWLEAPWTALEGVDPFGEDLTLALQVCYELHYRGFAGVDPVWEWDPGLLELRRGMEGRFLSALRAEVVGGDDVTAAVDALLVEQVPGTGVTHHLRDVGEWWQLREYVAHRSIYHLKEADPHAWVIPRLTGQAKAALVAVEFDEFGGGRGEWVHSKLFADLMRGVGLDDAYLHYLDDVPAPAIAVVNLMSLLGLHRSLRGAMVGHFTAAEVTSAPSAGRMTKALERLGAGPRCTLYFTEHMEADAVHEQIMRHDVVGDLLDREPELAAQVVFGVQATELLEDRLAEHLLSCWRAGRSSLRRPLPDHPAPA